MLLPVEKNLVSTPWSLTRGSCQGGWRGAWGPGMGGAGLCQMFSLVWIQYLIFSITGNILVSLKSKSSPATIFPQRQNPVGGGGGWGAQWPRERMGLWGLKKYLHQEKKQEREEEKKIISIISLPYQKPIPVERFPRRKTLHESLPGLGGLPQSHLPFPTVCRGAQKGPPPPRVLPVHNSLSSTSPSGFRAT